MASSQEKWDAESCRYTNQEDCFHWNLDNDLLWKKVQGNELHTKFMAISPYGVVAFVNIRDALNSPPLWENYEEYKKIQVESLKMLDKRTGGNTTLIEFSKCRFSGSDAIRIVTKMEIHDDVRSEVSYGVAYMFNKDKKKWFVNIKCTEKNWELVGLDGIKSLFAGFGPNHKPM